ncbi:hypothetical protein THRCLA_07402, partial [Thraustotheca clavata]
MTSRRNSLLPTAPLSGTHSRRGSIMTTVAATRVKRRPSFAVHDDNNTLPLLENPAGNSRAETTIANNTLNAWTTPRMETDLKTEGRPQKAGILSLEKSLELLDKILVDGSALASAPPALRASTATLASSPSTTVVTSPQRQPAAPARKTSYLAFTNPQREDLYDTINMLKQELVNERAARRLDIANGNAGSQMSVVNEASDDYFAALGRNAELHVRAKNLETVANTMKMNLEASKSEQKRTLDHVNMREEKLRNLIKKNKCLMAEYEVLKDQYVEAKVKSVEVHRTLQLEQKKMEATLHEMLQEKLKLQHDVNMTRTELKDLQKQSTTEKTELQSALTEVQGERDRLVLCLAETKHRFKQWKQRETKNLADAKNEARNHGESEAAIRINRCHEEIRLLRDKVAQLEQTSQLLKKEPHLSPMELSHRKQQLQTNRTSQEAEIIALTTRVQELEQMLVLSKSYQDCQNNMLTAAQETVSQILHTREVNALEQLACTSPRTPFKPNPPPQTPAESVESSLQTSTSSFALNTSATPLAEKIRVPPATAPSPRIQTQKRKGTYKQANSGVTTPTSPVSQLDNNLTVVTWRQEVRSLTEQVEEYKNMIVSLSHEIDKLKAERKRLSAQKQVEVEQKFQEILTDTQNQLEESKRNEADLRALLAKEQHAKETKSAKTIQTQLRVIMARNKLKAKLQAARAIQAHFKGFTTRKMTDLTKRTIDAPRDVLLATAIPLVSDEEKDVYVSFSKSPDCVKIQVWSENEVHTKHIPLWAVGNYVINGRDLVIISPDKLRRSIAGLVSLVRNDIGGVEIVVAELDMANGELTVCVEAVTKIQSRAKGFLTRKSVHQTKVSQIGAATTLQASTRGFLARKSYQEQIESICQIQAYARGYLSRRSVSIQKEAIVQIQAATKGMLTRKLMIKKQQSAILIQTQAKGFLARRKLKRHRHAAVRIQSKTKGHLKKKKYRHDRRKKKASTAIQARMRGYLTRKQLSRRRNAVTKIQCQIRGFIARKSYKLRQASALLIQCTTKAFLQRQKYLLKISVICKIQAFIRGYLTRQVICFRPRLSKRRCELLLDQHEFITTYLEEPVEFRIHCLNNPPCIKVEVRYCTMLYTTFVKYNRINHFIGFGEQLFNDNPNILSKTFEPLCSFRLVRPTKYKIFITPMENITSPQTPRPPSLPRRSPPKRLKTSKPQTTQNFKPGTKAYLSTLWIDETQTHFQHSTSLTDTNFTQNTTSYQNATTQKAIQNENKRSSIATSIQTFS